MFLAQGILGKNCWLPILTVPAASCPWLGYSAIGPCYFLKECSALSSALSYTASVRKGHEHFLISTDFALLNGNSIRKRGYCVDFGGAKPRCLVVNMDYRNQITMWGIFKISLLSESKCFAFSGKQAPLKCFWLSIPEQKSPFKGWTPCLTPVWTTAPGAQLGHTALGGCVGKPSAQEARHKSKGWTGE